SEPRWLQPCGGPSLLHRALHLLDRLDEADEKLFWSDDSSILEHFEQAGRTAIRLLPGPPVHALRRDQPGRPASHFVLRFDGRCPFLRPSTLDEAVRLVRIRFDVSRMVSCVRTHGPLFSVSGRSLTPALGGTPCILRWSPAFDLAPADQLAGLAHDVACVAEAMPFELGASEALRIDSSFEFDLVAAYFGARRAAEASHGG
ncbi:MAG: hypothetical protein MUF54_18625, partial [Polyangiaceae bacterium]|nr:hypothetical protein [Polyangiaceae bacterium]